MAQPVAIQAAIPYVFCADAGLVADWCVEVLGFVERDRWPDDDGVVRNVELIVGDGEVWLDGPVPDWKERLGDWALGSASWSLMWTLCMKASVRPVPMSIRREREIMACVRSA